MNDDLKNQLGFELKAVSNDLVTKRIVRTSQAGKRKGGQREQPAAYPDNPVERRGRAEVKRDERKYAPSVERGV
jgi:hypothetical protein